MELLVLARRRANLGEEVVDRPGDVVKEGRHLSDLERLRDLVLLLLHAPLGVAEELDLAHAEVGAAEVEGEEGALLGAVRDLLKVRGDHGPVCGESGSEGERAGSGEARWRGGEGAGEERRGETGAHERLVLCGCACEALAELPEHAVRDVLEEPGGRVELALDLGQGLVEGQGEVILAGAREEVGGSGRHWLPWVEG